MRGFFTSCSLNTNLPGSSSRIGFTGARGVSKVEARIDQGAWQQAQLRDPLSDTTWVIWRANLLSGEGEPAGLYGATTLTPHHRKDGFARSGRLVLLETRFPAGLPRPASARCALITNGGG